MVRRLVSDDYQFLAVPDGELRSSWAHCGKIAKSAEAHGLGYVLCPSSYQVGQDRLSFVAGCAPITDKINLFAAVRCGEMQPIMLARTVATLDHMASGRLTISIVSSDLPRQTEDGQYRYQRPREVIEILKQAWTRDKINHVGEFYNFSGLKTDPVKPYQTGGPLTYFGDVRGLDGSGRTGPRMGAIPRIPEWWRVILAGPGALDRFPSGFRP